MLHAHLVSLCSTGYLKSQIGPQIGNWLLYLTLYITVHSLRGNAVMCRTEACKQLKHEWQGVAYRTGRVGSLCSCRDQRSCLSTGSGGPCATRIGHTLGSGEPLVAWHDYIWSTNEQHLLSFSPAQTRFLDVAPRGNASTWIRRLWWMQDPPKLDFQDQSIQQQLFVKT